MAFVPASDYSKVAVWQIDDFAERYEQSIAEDAMISELFAFEHPEFGKVVFDLEFAPKESIDSNPTSLWMQIMKPPSVFLFSMECKAWMENEDGKRSEVKSENFSFDDGRTFLQWETFLSTQQKPEFIQSSTVYICCQLPYPVKSLGSISTKNTFYQWTITDFDSRFNAAQFQTSWKSDTFTVPEFKEVKLALKFYPKGENEEEEDECGLYLCIEDRAEHSMVLLQCDLWIKNSTRRLYKYTFNYVFSTVDRCESSSYITQEELLTFARNGPFDICCDVRPIIDTNLCLDCVSSRTEIALFFNDPYFSDAEIHVDDKVFKVSRLLISTKSPVFRAMFDKETKEQKSGVVSISGFEAAMIEKMLIYMYKGEVVDLNDIAFRLLPIADCYQVNDLVKKCCDSILSNLNVEEVLPILELAFALDHWKEFQDRVFNFAHENYDAIQDLDNYEDFLTERPKLAIKLLSVFYSSG
ncbi:hypothetical protein M3Y95_01000000 [Aphelenchoides besseyi]|nr:hypothetical protein M3Y95_01000000 [Aphelenchoides besseyi]